MIHKSKETLQFEAVARNFNVSILDIKVNQQYLRLGLNPVLAEVLILRKLRSKGFNRFDVVHQFFQVDQIILKNKVFDNLQVEVILQQVKTVWSFDEFVEDMVVFIYKEHYVHLEQVS